MSASNTSTVTMRAPTEGSLERDGLERSSPTFYDRETSNNFRDVNKVGSIVQGSSSDLLCVGTWAINQQNPDTDTSPEEAQKVVPQSQRPCTQHHAIHSACLGSSDNYRAIISLLDETYAAGSTDRAEGLWAGSSSAAACTCVTEIEADIDGAQVTAVTTNGAKAKGRQTNGIK